MSSRCQITALASSKHRNAMQWRTESLAPPIDLPEWLGQLICQYPPVGVEWRVDMVKFRDLRMSFAASFAALLFGILRTARTRAWSFSVIVGGIESEGLGRLDDESTQQQNKHCFYQCDAISFVRKVILR